MRHYALSRLLKGNAFEGVSTTSRGAAIDNMSIWWHKNSRLLGRHLTPRPKIERCKYKGIILILQTNGQNFKDIYQKWALR